MSNNNHESFLEGLRIDKNKQRLFELKRKLDNEEIEIEDLSNEEAKGLIELYDLEVKSINSETNRIKDRIKKELTELRKQNSSK